MRICFVTHASNYHSKKWAGWFVSRGHEVHVISFAYEDIPGATVHSLASKVKTNDSDLKKLGYLAQAGRLRKLIREIKPDIVNVHYASSYGTLAALSGIRGYILSVWGLDVYEFPRKSIIHREALKFSLARARYLFSTSRAMARESSRYTRKKFMITPFGVDMGLFNPDKRTRQADDADFVIGTVKSLTPKYGIDVLLKAAAIVAEKRPDIRLKVRIAGKGPREEEYKELGRTLGIDDITTWLGFIPQEDAAREWANMDIALVPSVDESESFGVSAVEAQACGTPVVISDIPGLMEATKPGYSSLVVKRNSGEELAGAIIDLYDSPQERARLAENGRAFVKKHYDLDDCFEKIEKFFLKKCGQEERTAGQDQ